MLTKTSLNTLRLFLSMLLMLLLLHLLQTAIPVQATVHALTEFTCTNLQAVPTAFTNGNEHITGEKPQSKVWRHAERWWGIFPTSSSGAPSAGTWLWRLDSDTWTPVLKVADSTNVQADVKVAGNVIHALLYDDVPQLVSAEYSSGSYQLWSARTTAVALPAGDETGVIELDSTGRLWYVTDTSSAVVAYYSDAPYATWNGPVTIVDGINADDIGAVVALPNNQIGVLWSDQNRKHFGFKTHSDGSDPATWSASEIADSGSNIADDHINLAVAGDGTLYAAVKTSTDLVKLLVRTPAGTWQGYPVDENGVGTRPIVLVNQQRDEVTVIYTSANGLNPILYKESARQSISFGPRKTLRSGGFNDVSSTKQAYTDQLVVLFTDYSNIAGVFCTASSTAPTPTVTATVTEQPAATATATTSTQPTPTATSTATGAPAATVTATASPEPAATATNTPTTTATASATPVATTISPETGGALTQTVGDLTVQLHFPPGAVSEMATVKIASASEQPALPEATELVGSYVTLAVTDLSNQAVMTFAEPVTLTVLYRDAALGGDNPEERADGVTESLGLYIWLAAEAQWAALPTTVDTRNQSLTATLTQPGIVAVLASRTHQLYLPTIHQ